MNSSWTARSSLCLFVTWGFLGTSTTVAESNWPGFLGPGGVAVADANVSGIPVSFEEWDESILWKISSGSGHSSPCIWGRYLFFTSAEDNGANLVMKAIDRRNGESLWEYRVKGNKGEPFGHRASNPAAPTPCCDGEHVVFYFGGYGLIVCDMKTGKVLWEKRFPFTPQTFGTGDSPVYYQGSVIVARDGSEDSALWCFDIPTGDVKWKAPRPGHSHNYSTPFIWKNHLRTEIVKAGSGSLISYDPQDGSVLWNVQGLCAVPSTTPTGNEERLYYAAWSSPNADLSERSREDFWGDVSLTDEEASDPAISIKLFDLDRDGKLTIDELPDSRGRDVFDLVDQNKDGFWTREELALSAQMNAPGRNLMIAVEAGHLGDLSEEKGIAWTFDLSKALPFVPTPLTADGKIHLVKSGGVTTCLDGMTGELLYGPLRSGISGEYFSSPIAWGDGIFLSAHRGVIQVLAKGERFEKLAQRDVGEEIYATPAVVENTLYLRTEHHLWAVRGKEKEVSSVP